MSTAESVLEKLTRLPEEKQQQVLLYVESLSGDRELGNPYSFLDVAMSLKLEGPADWSVNFEEYLNGDKKVLSEVLFLDSAYAIALASPGDEFHARAAELANDIRARNARLLTTEAVLLEIGDSMSKPRFRRAAVSLLESLLADPRVEVLPLTRELVHNSFNLFRQRLDKSWGLTDCLSFLVMQQRGIHQALTTDEHFQQAGFEALLQEA